MLDAMIDLAFRMFFPNAPAWIGALLTTAVPAAIDLIEAVDEAKEKTGAEKFEFVVSEVRELIDEGFDTIPEWSEYPEAGRDQIIAGLTELAVFIHRIAEDESPQAARRKVRKAIKKIR